MGVKKKLFLLGRVDGNELHNITHAMEKGTFTHSKKLLVDLLLKSVPHL